MKSYPKMPLVDFTSSLFEGVDLSNVTIIAVQHILEGHLIYFLELFKHGLKPENVYLLGKAYSTNQEVLKEFQNLGCYVDSGSTSYNSHEAFCSQFESYIKEFLNKTPIADAENIVVLDDGGHLIHEINKSEIRSNNITCIEQTSSGFHLLSDDELNMPVINIARSQTKLEQETDFIGSDFVERLDVYAQRAGAEIENVLILGGGYIGRSIADQLPAQYKVSIFDKNIDQYKLSDNVLSELIKNADVIIGATGQTSLSNSMHGELKNNVILASASSNDAEFDAVYFRKKLDKNESIHQNLKVENVTLLNSGFPITFDGSRQPIKHEFIQITEALLLAACFLAVTKEYENGFVELDHKIQEAITTEFTR